MNAAIKLLPGPRRVTPVRRPMLLALAVVAASLALLWMLDGSEEPGDTPAIAMSAGNRTAAATATAVGFVRRTLGQFRRDLFASHSWHVAPPPPPVVAKPGPPPAPTAPPLPFTVIGSYQHAGESAVFFLVQGDRIYDVRVGDVIDATYSVDRVESGRLQFTYLPLNIKQELAVGSPE